MYICIFVLALYMHREVLHDCEVEVELGKKKYHAQTYMSKYEVRTSECVNIRTRNSMKQCKRVETICSF